MMDCFVAVLVVVALLSLIDTCEAIQLRRVSRAINHVDILAKGRSAKRPIRADKASKLKNKQDEIGEKVVVVVNRFKNGLSMLPTQFTTSQKLKKKRKEEGGAALTYSEYMYIEQARDDFMKCIRLALTASISPEFFFYSNLIIPAISSGNPWAWKALPSGFDTPEDEQVRNNILIKRRQHALFNGMTSVLADTIDDAPQKKQDMRKDHIKLVEAALKAKKQGMQQALEELEPLFASESSVSAKGKKAKVPKGGVKMTMNNLPWTAVRDACRSFGIDGMPNVFVLRRLNKGEISRRFDVLRKTDEFLHTIGVDTLADEELVSACIDRCINIDSSRGMSELRRDLSEWLHLTGPASPVLKQNGLNEQNVRLALSALHTSQGCQNSQFSSVMRALAK